MRWLHDSLLAVSKLRSINQQLKIDDIPSRVVDVLRDLSEKERSPDVLADLTRVDQALLGILFPFQKQGVRYLYIFHNIRLTVGMCYWTQCC